MIMTSLHSEVKRYGVETEYQQFSNTEMKPYVSFSFVLKYCNENAKM